MGVSSRDDRMLGLIFKNYSLSIVLTATGPKNPKQGDITHHQVAWMSTSAEQYNVFDDFAVFFRRP